MTLPGDWAETGAALFPGAIAALIPVLTAAADALPADRAGVRLHGIAALAPVFAPEAAAAQIASAAMGAPARPVRAILFDKSAAANWALGWHQDRTIAVRRRVDVPGFGPWTVKAGIPHVAPPPELHARMVTARLHLDPVPAGNAPLLIAPGSHRLGRITEDEVDRVVARCGIRACLAEAGDVWLYATPILHASDAAAQPARRRVLQNDFAAEPLPGGLEWHGV